MFKLVYNQVSTFQTLFMYWNSQTIIYTSTFTSELVCPETTATINTFNVYVYRTWWKKSVVVCWFYFGVTVGAGMTI